MSNKEMVMEILNKFSCLTANQIKIFINQEFGAMVSAPAISGLLRPMVNAGKVGSSVGPTGHVVYWRN